MRSIFKVYSIGSRSFGSNYPKAARKSAHGFNFSLVSNGIDKSGVRGTFWARNFSDSVTYSGGQASEGQGGFYGSGGSRVKTSAPTHHPEAQARKDDIDEARQIMDDIHDMEGKLLAMGNSPVTTESMILKNEINKKARSARVKELLGRLEIKGEPVWGLDVSERELVRELKEKYMNL